MVGFYYCEGLCLTRPFCSVLRVLGPMVVFRFPFYLRCEGPTRAIARMTRTMGFNPGISAVSAHRKYGVLISYVKAGLLGLLSVEKITRDIRNEMKPNYIA